MPNFKIILSYDGTNYAGFQWQLNAPSIQGKVEDALKMIYGRRIVVTGAGRTDSGVHARGQVISFYADGRVPAARMPYALQGLLPRDIVARTCEEVGNAFNARASAREKVYCYTLDTSSRPDVFLRRYAYHYPKPLNLEKMREAAAILAQEHDFTSFRASNSTILENTRHLKEAEIREEGAFLRFYFRADGYLYKMVRIMVGTLLFVGEGRIKTEDLPAIIAARDRAKAGPTAPAHGLCLEEVIY